MAETGELSSYINRIDNLTSTSTEQYDTIKDITKKHWKGLDTRKLCVTRSCRKPFSLRDRPHHCRRCGEVFCANCVKHQRKLNKLAHPDPDGKTYKVCVKCFEEGRVTEGVSRKWTNDFTSFRNNAQIQRQALSRGQETSSRRDKLRLDKECDRLKQGFKKSIGRSEVKRTLQEMRGMVGTPDWQKSSIWIQENLATKCSKCGSDFSLLKSKRSCCVCGVAVCKNCSVKDLLLYIPDDRIHSDITEPQLAIIRIIGCPEVEPEVSISLRICFKCHGIIVENQVANYEREEKTDSDFLTKLIGLHERFQVAEENVNKHLPEYQAIITSLENNSRNNENKGGSNMKTLAKAQEDLADFLAQHVLIVQSLKSIKPATGTQSTILKYYIKSKCDFYLENMSNFRQLKKQLSETSPPEVLEIIQRIMNKDSIVSAHLYIRQLIYESINICTKYKLNDACPRILMSVEEKIESDTFVCLRREGEDCSQHEELVQQMIKSQISHHKLIRTSKTLLKKQGTVHAKNIMLSRGCEVLNQLLIQLQLKTSNKSFTETKNELQKAIGQMESFTSSRY